MTIQPDDQETIFQRVKSAIAKATRITNFSPTSPEKAIADDVFAAELRERQHELLAVQLSARIEFAGRGADDSETPIDADALEGLGLDPSRVDLDLLNSFVESDDLDALVARNSVSRDPGSFATGTVTFTTANDGVVIPQGTVVTTPPDADGETTDFLATEEVTPSAGRNTVDADVRAVERGTGGNLGSGSLVNLPDPPPGVIGDPAVSNAAAVTGGEDAESNAELRERSKKALVGTAGGGTTAGIEGEIVESFDGLDLEDVVVDENPTGDPQDFDVVVDGGPSDSTLSEKIDELQPTAIEGTLVRPTTVTVDVTTDVTGTDVDTSTVENEIVDVIAGLGLGENLIRDQIVAAIITADDGLVGISSLDITADGTAVADDLSIADRETVEAGTVSVTVV